MLGSTAPASRPNTKPGARYHGFGTDDSEANLIARLPEAAQRKLKHLQQIETRMRALSAGLFEALNTARENLASAQRDLAIFDRRNPAEENVVADEKTGERKRIEVDPPGRAPLLQQVERCKAEVARLAAEQATTNLGFSISEILD